MRKATNPYPTPQPDPVPAAGKPVQQVLWTLLDALALCRRRLGLAPNSLSVLRALISFLPRGATSQGPLLVWPSNRTLSERAGGMDERTLRRHLGRLVDAGLIERRTSSNGKRFAVRSRSIVVTAFGFDLAPLLAKADELRHLAQDERTESEQCAALRVQILNQLHARHTSALPTQDEAEIRKMLRRRCDSGTLARALESLSAQVPQPPAPTQLTASHRQIDRHQQRTGKDSLLSVRAPTEPLHPADMPESAENRHIGNTDSDLTLHDCLAATPESQSFSPTPVRTWADILRLAETLAPMIGIGAELAHHARRAMGPIQAAVSILCVIERSAHIRRPAAYLRRLALLAESGQYSLASLVRSAARARFAGANHSPA